MKLSPIDITEAQGQYLKDKKKETGTSFAAQVRILIQEQIDKK